MNYLHPKLFPAIVSHARRTNPFYARWLPERGPIPILDRLALLENNTEILNGHVPNARTSGSTGVPVSIHHSRRRLDCNLPAFNLFLKHLGGPLTRTQIVHPHESENPVPIVPVASTPAEQVAALRRHLDQYNATAVITYPSNAEWLARYILEHQIDLGFIERLGMISEPIDMGQRALIQRAFPNAKLWSTYSSMEFGLISFECPYEPDFHHASVDKLGIEVLDETGRDCPPGQLGRLVITDYYNTEMPLIRYEIGDLAAFATCPCGRIALPALRDILGKVRGCLVHRDGRRIPFLALSVALRDTPGMRQFQVIQEALEHFTVKVVAHQDLSVAITAAFTAEFGYTPRLDIVPVELIPRDPNGKFYISICKI